MPSFIDGEIKALSVKPALDRAGNPPSQLVLVLFFSASVSNLVLDYRLCYWLMNGGGMERGMQEGWREGSGKSELPSSS